MDLEAIKELTYGFTIDKIEIIEILNLYKKSIQLGDFKKQKRKLRKRIWKTITM